MGGGLFLTTILPCFSRRGKKKMEKKRTGRGERRRRRRRKNLYRIILRINEFEERRGCRRRLLGGVLARSRVEDDVGERTRESRERTTTTTTTTKSGYFEACTRSPFSDGTGRKDFDPAVQSARVRQGGRREH